jgi:uncharacterized protein
MSSANAGLFKGHQYINLETFRKNGDGVRTPVWFAQEGETLYVWTDGTSGKAKRIRHTPQVRIAPSDARGTPRGEWVTATASLHPLDTAVYEQGNRLLNNKYGLLKRFFEWMNRSGKQNRVIIEIHLPGSTD